MQETKFSGTEWKFKMAHLHPLIEQTTLEQVYLPSDPRLEWPGERPLFELNLNKCQGQNVGTIRVTSKCGRYSGYYLCQAWALGQIRHQCKSLSYVAEYVYQICLK